MFIAPADHVGTVNRISEYCQHAAECRLLAATMTNDDQREQLLAMAETWDRLADERERTMKIEESPSFAPAGRAEHCVTG